MTTERRNPRSVDIDLFPTERVLKIINAEDALVANAVANVIPDIAKLVDLGVQAIRSGGHVIYVGAGTSGRLAMTDQAAKPNGMTLPASPPSYAGHRFLAEIINHATWPPEGL